MRAATRTTAHTCGGEPSSMRPRPTASPQASQRACSLRSVLCQPHPPGTGQRPRCSRAPPARNPPAGRGRRRGALGLYFHVPGVKGGSLGLELSRAPPASDRRSSTAGRPGRRRWSQHEKASGRRREEGSAGQRRSFFCLILSSRLSTIL